MARPLKSLTLFAREAEVPLQESSVARVEPRQPELWLSICLPNLALEALGLRSAHEPLVVTEPGREHLLIAAANDAARAHGVRPGLQLNAAVALAASLEAVARSPAAERACLEAFAAWAHCLTPTASLEPPESVSLEVAGSLKLFGGLAALKEALASELARRGWAHRSCAAPTPLASLWLARAGAADVLELAQLPKRIGALSLAVTDWPSAVRDLLHEMGARTIGDCLRLPRGGFARRVGRERLHDLDKALGKRFDPRPRFTAPVRFECSVELDEESADRELLIAAVAQMLDPLAEKLRREQAQIQSFSLSLMHLREQPTIELFELVEPAARPERLLSLAADRLERIALAAPAIGLRLTTGALRPLAVRVPDLFAAGPASEPPNVLLERLRERFGTSGVYGLVTVADHRPEHAWTKGLPREARAIQVISPWACDRPLWVLPAPVPLESSAARRHCAGSLQLASEPERIESGWWDEHDVARDYYTAIGPHGQRLWIYRDLANGVWHLHGIFG